MVDDANVGPLLERARKVVSMQGGLALAIVGEPGIGKSHAAQRLLSALSCRSLSRPATVPLGSLVQALPRSAKLPAWVERAAERIAAGKESDPSTLAAALATLLARAAPFVLHLDDLHEAHPERRDLIKRLALACHASQGVALVVGSREGVAAPFEEVRLAPLAEGAAAALLESAASATLPPAALAWIHARAAGNPLFTLEYLRHLSRAGFLWSDGQRWNWREPQGELLPTRIEALIEQMVRRAKALSPAAAGALEARALLPRGAVDRNLWRALAELEEPALSAAATHLRQAGLLDGNDFAHPLMREVTNATLTRVRRRELARKAVDLLSAAPLHAATFVADAELADEAAARLLLAGASAAPNEVLAARLRAQASERLGGARRAELAFSAANVLVNHDLRTATALYERAATSSHAEPEMVRAYAHVLARQGQVPEVLALLGALPAQLRERLDPVELEITSNNVAGDHQAALTRWRERPELHEGASPELLRAAAGSALATGEMALAEELLQRGAQAAHGTELRCEFLSLRALVAYHRGDHAEADALIRVAIEELRTLGAPRLLGVALLNRAAFLKLQGNYREMGDCLEESLRLRREAFDQKGHAFTQAALAELRIEQGQLAEAEDLLDEARETLALYGPSRHLVNTLSISCLLYLAQELPELALKYAEQALAMARDLGNLRVVRELLFEASVANSRSGNHERGLELAQESERLAATAGDSPIDAYRTAWAAAHAFEAEGELLRAAERLEAALAGAKAANVALDANKIALDLALLRRDERSAAQLLGWFDAHGLQLGAAAIRRAFPPLNETEGTHGQGARLEVLGPMRFVKDGVERPVRGERRQLLLGQLLQRRVARLDGMPDLELVDLLYPGLDEEAALSALKQLVHQVRRALGASVVTRVAGGYALGSVGSDLEEFLDRDDSSLALWRGAYFQGAEGHRDEEVAARVHRLAIARASAALATAPESALRLARLLQLSEPYDLEPVVLEVLALEAMGESSSLQDAYARARQRFAEVGEELPDDPRELLALHALG